MLDELIKGFSGPGAAFMYVITAVLALGLAVTLERALMDNTDGKWEMYQAMLMRAFMAHDLALRLIRAARPGGRSWLGCLDVPARLRAPAWPSPTPSAR